MILDQLNLILADSDKVGKIFLLSEEMLNSLNTVYKVLGEEKFVFSTQGIEGVEQLLDYLIGVENTILSDDYDKKYMVTHYELPYTSWSFQKPREISMTIIEIYAALIKAVLIS